MMILDNCINHLLMDMIHIMFLLFLRLYIINNPIFGTIKKNTYFTPNLVFSINVYSNKLKVHVYIFNKPFIKLEK